MSCGVVCVEMPSRVHTTHYSEQWLLLFLCQSITDEGTQLLQRLSSLLLL